MHACAHVCTQANHRPRTPGHTLAHVHAHARTPLLGQETRASTRARTCTRMHARACMRFGRTACVSVHSCPRANQRQQMYVHTHAHTCTHTHACWPTILTPATLYSRPPHPHMHTVESTYVHIREHVCMHTRTRFCRCMHNKLKSNRDCTCVDTYGHTPIRATHPPA